MYAQVTSHARILFTIFCAIELLYIQYRFIFAVNSPSENNMLIYDESQPLSGAQAYLAARWIHNMHGSIG